ncbi:MAG TPA: TIGR03084 family metal-binding protein [Burkholderiaceae bacterium]|nr:TIGR03084 family metal-binding protein [Burkholderiaceae bacterium]
MFEQPADFRDESEALYQLLAPLKDADFQRPSRFKQWTINEVITHLHFWNVAVQKALIDEPAFVTLMADLSASLKTSSMRAYEKQWAGPLTGQSLLKAWREQFGQVADHFQKADPKQRVKWAGPDMSARSSITARLMETWAHGQAVYDMLGVERVNTDRIRNIAVLGINTFGWTFATHKQPLPAIAPHVRLTAPSGAVWTWNDPSETDLIEGSATEFCQVVTQVRNIADTRLTVRGEAATRWMAIAQCFAGPPETPPAPGTRFRETVAG